MLHLQSKGDELCINTIVCLAKFFIHLKTLKGPKAQKIYDTLKLFPTEING